MLFAAIFYIEVKMKRALDHLSPLLNWLSGGKYLDPVC